MQRKENKALMNSVIFLKKLLINFIYGKSMENIRKKISVKLVNK